MKTNILLIMVAMVTAALAAALGQGNTAADAGDGEAVPPNEKLHTVYITKLTTLSSGFLIPTTSSPFVVATAIVHETIWSDPILSTWTTVAAGTELPATLSTSTAYTTVKVVADSVTFTTTTVRRRSPGPAGAGSVGAIEPPPPSSITADLPPVSASSPPEGSLPPPILSAPVSSTITTILPLRSDPTEPPPLPPTSIPSGTAPAVTLSLSEAPSPPVPSVPATTLMTSVVPPPAPTPAPTPSNISCVDNWCSDDGSSYCLYWGGITAENSAGEPLPGMVLTHFGGCTLVTTTLSGGEATTMIVSAPDPPPSGPAVPVPPGPATPPSAGPGATPAPFSTASPSPSPSPSPEASATVDVYSVVYRPRVRGRIQLG